ncbi:MBL fold metallo-hydrolase [Arthrobacter zhaoguopingii]|uniref:MBL fold metallo-hydrolase n=1 Tax=Arthrobacter zhaoguopingii TaxID=2681491 RepID=UPI00135C1AE9|nr:MBL fold metallo-hydrolase [Arthrobacter zhaoguopingii]
MEQLRITHIGGPTALVELDGWRILTDPTFDGPGRRYRFGLGTSSVKTGRPALQPADLGPVDAVLLSHDHHADNLDNRGRQMLSSVPTVVTTRSGAKRLALPNTHGLRPWEQMTLRKPGISPLRIIATPARHGPALSLPVVGQTLGFALQRPGEDTLALWMSGDSVLYRGLRDVARRFEIDVALLHLGAVRFRVTGPVRYTMNARDAARLLKLIRPQVAIPVHYEGWSHFSEGRSLALKQLHTRPDKITEVLWLPPGRPVPIPLRSTRPAPT